MTRRPQAGFIPALDGLRGIAIILVMLHHFTYYRPTSGIDALIGSVLFFFWTGVDLFFVLSGFLITGILLDTRGSERYFTTFYARRILRIFPLYYLVLFLAFVVLPEFPAVHPVLAGQVGRLAAAVAVLVVLDEFLDRRPRVGAWLGGRGLVARHRRTVLPGLAARDLVVPAATGGVAVHGHLRGRGIRPLVRAGIRRGGRCRSTSSPGSGSTGS